MNKFTIPLMMIIVAVLLIVGIMFTGTRKITTFSTSSINAVTNDAPIKMGTGNTLREYELRVQGRKIPIKVIEFLDKKGHHCVVMTVMTELEFECEGH